MSETAPDPAPSPRALDASGAPLLAAAVALGDAVARLVRAEGGLTMAQLEVLAVIVRAGGPLEPRQIARLAGVGSGHLTAVLDGLERGGLVTRRRHDDDGRRRLIEPTGEGARRLEWIRALVAAAERRMLDAAPARPGEGAAEHLGRLRAVGALAPPARLRGP